MTSGSPTKPIIVCMEMIKIWGVIVYIISGYVTRNKLDDISHHTYFMGYADNTGFILYWKSVQNFYIHRYHNYWFDEYNHRLSIQDNYTPGSLILQKYPESLLHNLDLINLIPCELDLTSTPFSDTIFITHEIELPPSRNKIGSNLLDCEYFTIPYVIDKIPNLPAGHQLLTQAKKNVWIISINVEDSITTQCAFDELQSHQTWCGKYKVNIGLFRRKRYQRTDLEYIWSIFDQVRLVISHIEVCLPYKPLTPKNIDGYLKGTQRKFQKNIYLCNMKKTKMSVLFWIPQE